MAAAAALLAGNLPLPIEGSSPRNAMSDRNAKMKQAEMAVNRSRRDQHHHHYLPLIIDGKRRGSNSSPSKMAASYSSSSSTSSSEGGDGGGGVGGGDWEEDLKRKLKDMEEMKELERRAAEIQSQVAEEFEGEDGKETEEEKRERVRRELEKVAKEQAERRETAKLMFELGQKAYEKGMYARAIEFLEAALTIIPWPTLFGGEIQIWLAMAYEANNRHKDCIALYQLLEKKHPSVSIRRQAAELRYILQAPKLKISKDEMVTIPLIGSSYDSYAGTWSDKYKDRDQRRRMVTTNQPNSSRDFFGDFTVWRPPSGLEENRYGWLFLALWIGVVGTVLLYR